MTEILNEFDKFYVIVNLFLQNNFYTVLSVLLVILIGVVGMWVVSHVKK